MFTRLAYAELGKEPPEGDLYAIPELEEYRTGVKLAMNTLLFDSHITRRTWPSKIGVGIGPVDDEALDAEMEDDEEIKREAYLPAGYGVAKTKKAILRVHPDLKAAWGIELGYHLMFIESEILMADGDAQKGPRPTDKLHSLRQSHVRTQARLRSTCTQIVKSDAGRRPV